MPKYRRTRELLEATGLFDLQPAPVATRDIIELAHDPAYVTAFLEGTLSPHAIRRIGFPWSEHLVKRTLASVGGTLAATDDALSTGCGGTLAGGTHHAFRAEGSGFCVFNDIAIAIENLRTNHIIRRAVVLDCDVHQGDGTAQIFQDHPDVLTISIHSKTNFPFRKQRSAIDLELPDGTTDDTYLDALASVIPRLLAFEPEIVFFQSGVDALATDALGKLSLTQAGLHRRDELVFTTARDHDLPLVITLGGGYSRPIELTAQAHAQTFRLAAQILR
jgi:acetoin utilization deacetylase AcuC-like enzyme